MKKSALKADFFDNGRPCAFQHMKCHAVYATIFLKKVCSFGCRLFFASWYVILDRAALYGTIEVYYGADTWDGGAVYPGGDTISYRGRQYRAKWWTRGETPGTSDVWEDSGY